MKKIVLTLILYLFIIGQAFAITGVPDSTHWEFAWYGGGGRFDMVVADKFVANKFYAISDVGSPMVTTNAGETWTWLSYTSANGFDAPQPTALVQSADDANQMYLISGNTFTTTSGRLIKSTDGGQSWIRKTNNKASRTSSGKVLAYDPTNDNIAYAGLDNGTVIQTTDDGETWPVLFTPFGTDIKPAWIYVSPSGDKVYVGGTSTQGVKVYDVSAATTTTVSFSGSTTLSTYSTDYDTYLDGSAVEHLCIATGVKIACTDDPEDGELSTWTYTQNVLATANYYIGRFAVSYNAGTLNFVAFVRLTTSPQGGSVEKYSNDGGTTWSTSTVTKNTTMNPTQTITTGGRSGAGMTKDPNNPNVFFYATDWTIFRSDDAGANFAEKIVGAGNTITSDITIAPNGYLFACSMDTGCQRSVDNGVTWTQVVPTTNSNIGHYWRVITLGSLSDWQAGNGIVIVTTTRYTQSSATNYRNIPARSTDNGATFSFITTGFPTVGMYGDTIWDRGYMRAISASEDGSVVYVGMDGENCDGDGPGGDAFSCSLNNATGGIFKSTDYGATWARSNGGAVVSQQSPRKIYNGVAVDPTDATGSTLLAGTWGYNMYRSTNAGSSWSYVGDASGPSGYTYDIAYDSNGTPYSVGTYNGPVLYRSVITAYGDGSGQYGTWQLMKRFHSDTITSGIADGLKIDPQNNDRIFVSETLGTGGNSNFRRVFVTTDADSGSSATWYDITGDLPAVGGCQDLEINYNEGTRGYLYCASNGNGVFKLDLADSPTIRTGQTSLGGHP